MISSYLHTSLRDGGRQTSSIPGPEGRLTFECLNKCGQVAVLEVSVSQPTIVTATPGVQLPTAGQRSTEVKQGSGQIRSTNGT